MILGIVVAGILAFLAVYFMLPQPKSPNIPMPWQAHKQHNVTQIFGLTLGESTLKNAMQIFGREAEVSLFKDKDKGNNNTNKEVEVYFSSTKIGGMSIKVILSLEVTQDILITLNKNIKNHEIMPSGNEKVEFNDFAKNQLLNQKIKHLSFIPRTTLDDKDIIARFGEPNTQTKDAWYYPDQGLKIVRDGELNIFEYSN